MVRILLEGCFGKEQGKDVETGIWRDVVANDDRFFNSIRPK